MSTEIIFAFIIAFWFITVPLIIWISYTIVTEFLDLIFNTQKIKELLKQSDKFDYSSLSDQYHIEKKRQSKLSISILMELERQINYKRMLKYNPEDHWNKKYKVEKERVSAAKFISDIFKIS